MKTVELPWGLGVVHPLDSEQTCDWILTSKPDTGQARILGNVNLHALYLGLDDGPVRELTRASDVVLIDGWPILQLARFAGPRSSRPTAEERIGSSDWLTELLERDPDILVIAIGGAPETAAKMVEHVASRTSTLRWKSFDGFEFVEQGVPSGAAEELSSVLGRADLVLVGLGMPKQEAWILEHLGDLNPQSVIANVGGCFDYFVGAQKLAPRWMGAAGLEWFYRLIHSPRRLAGRYLIEPLLLAGRLVSRGVRVPTRDSQVGR